MKVHPNHVAPKLGHIRVSQRGQTVSIMAVGHLLCVKTFSGEQQIVNEMISFQLLFALLTKIPPQPEQPYNKIP